MTQQYGDHTSPEAQRSTPAVARDEAAEVARTAADKGGEVAGTVGEQANRLASETKQQARNLFQESREQLTGQARQGQQRAADGIRTVADQLRQMSEKADDKGVVSEVARQAADRTQSVASWLENREPGDLLDEVRRFARRKPGVFLLGAALAGVAVGRLTRGAIAANSDDTGHGAGHGAGHAAPGGANPPRHAQDQYPAQPAAPVAAEWQSAPPAYPTQGVTAPPAYPTQVPGAPANPVAPQTWEPQPGQVNR